MAKNNTVLTGSHFMNGDIAAAEGGIYAGCRFFGGYPITPATEIAERMSWRLPQIGGVYIQMEDEIASIGTVLGASWGGAKSMTATSGPGFSLMLENIGLGIMMEAPCVIINVQRGGPSTGLPTLVGQGDVMQAKWGSHGPYEIIALAPQSPQEMFDYTVKAFNLSEKYRTPVIILADEVVGHMTEKVVIPPQGKIKLFNRRKPRSMTNHKPYKINGSLVPLMASAGDGGFIHSTGLTHDERGYPVVVEEAQVKYVQRLIDKILLNKDDIIEYEEKFMDDADILILSYGISARTAMHPIKKAREKGLKVGLFRLITIWPFPDEIVTNLAKKYKAIIVPEINNGQIAGEVQRCAFGKADVIPVTHLGGHIHNPDDIYNAIVKASKKKGK